MNLKHTVLMSLFMSLFLSVTYSMESNSIKGQLVEAIKSLNVGKVKELTSQAKSILTLQDKQDLWAEISRHPVRNYSGKMVKFEYNLLLALQVGGFFAICTLILWLFKDGEVPPIVEYYLNPEKNSEDVELDKEKTNSIEKPKKINYPKTFMSHFNHYQMKLANLMKNGAKYTCGGITVSAATYGLIQFGLIAYHDNYYKKFHKIKSVVNESFPKNK